MALILISYRRQDSAIAAGRIYDNLEQFYGTDSVFLDIDKIPIGFDFREFIDNEVSRCDVVLVVIGERWVELIQAAKNDPGDFVLIEIESALRRKIPVVPVFLGPNIRPPSEAQLPTSIKELAYRNGIVVDPAQDFRIHMERLKRALSRILPSEKKLESSAPQETEPHLTGYVTGKYGDAIYGSNEKYEKDVYLGRASKGVKLMLIDKNVKTNEFGFHIIKVKILSENSTGPTNVICWIKLNNTSFKDRYDAQSKTVR